MQSFSQIFLCYRRPDRKIAETLYRKLKDSGYHPWIDRSDPGNGELPQNMMERTMRQSAVALLCLTGQTFDRHGRLQHDFNLSPVLLDEIMQGGIAVIPVLLQALALPEHWQRLAPVELTGRRGVAALLNRIDETLERLNTPAFTLLRSEPCSAIPAQEVQVIVRERGFADLAYNPLGRGLRHQYRRIEQENLALISDSSTGLQWQQKGSSRPLCYHDAVQYIKALNRNRHAGYADWRMPTLEEALSLMEPVRSSEGLFLAADFDPGLMSIWTADSDGGGRIWNVNFCFGYSYTLPASSHDHVCAVRTCPEHADGPGEWLANPAEAEERFAMSY